MADEFYKNGALNSVSSCVSAARCPAQWTATALIHQQLATCRLCTCLYVREQADCSYFAAGFCMCKEIVVRILFVV